MAMRVKRRRLLKLVAVGTLATTAAGHTIDAVSASARHFASSPFAPGERATLLAAMDEIIPREGDLPAASEAGVLGYLETLSARDSTVRGDLRRTASALERGARPGHFASISTQRRVQILTTLERDHEDLFGSLRDYVYEGYYTNSQVWTVIGFQFYGPERSGPGVGVFDEQSVERVRAMPALYRRVP